MTDVSIRTLVLELVDAKGACHIRELHLEVLQRKPGTPERFDFVWIHPPYWNIVQYRSGPGDLSNCDSYERFREMLTVCLRRCYDALEQGGRLAVLVGDVRRSGRYTPIVKDVLNFPHGEIRSIIIKVQHNCTSDSRRYGKMEDVPIRHEYCVVFKKTGEAARPWQPPRVSQVVRA